MFILCKNSWGKNKDKDSIWQVALSPMANPTLRSGYIFKLFILFGINVDRAGESETRY